MQQSQTQQQQQQQQQIVPDTFLPLKNQRLINEENSPVDLSKLNIEQQQQQQQRQQNSIIFPSSSSSSTTNAKLNSIVGMDLTVAHNNNNGQSQSSTSTTISTTSTTLESHSKHIKKVLKHYQAAATLSLNGPDWFLPIVSATTTTTNASTINGNNNSMIVSSAAAAAAASQSLTDNDVLELTKTKSNTVVDNNKIAGIFNTTTLDLRTTTAAASTLNSSSTATITNNNKQTLSPYLSAAAAAVGGGGGGHSSLSTNQGLTSLKDIFDPLFAPPPFPIQQPPLLTPPDQGPNRIERTETKLEGELIACFMVGGELRLCVPQIFNIVLRDFTLQQINQVIEELQINCSTCTRDQMEVLKLNGDIPPMAPSCGLITKTDAHRLCSTLLGSSTGGSCVGGNITETTFINEPYILVYHECFGRCIGRYLPTLYTNDLAQCIQCNECMSLFTTFSFVCHSHKQQQQQQQYGNENRTVHWGFDPLNWRSYLLPIEDLASLDDLSSSLLMIISSNNLQSLLIDQKNLSHLLLLLQNSKLSASSASSSSASSTLLIPPCCTGGRKAFKSSKSSMTTSDALYQSIDNIRLIMKDMKCRFAKQTSLASSSSSSKLNSSSRSSSTALLTGNSKRKDITFDTSILSTKPSSLLMSLESQLNQTLSSNKRIKTEPLDLHHPQQQQHYSNIGGGGNGGDNLSTTMSPFVYPFLQSYLTSGMMMTQPPSSLSNDDLKQQTKSQKDFFTTQQQQQQQKSSNTNYLSTLLNGAALAAATATSSVNSLTSSSLINNNNTNSSNAFITNILQNKSLDSSTTTTNKLQSKSLFQANNYGQLASTVNNTDRLYNLSNVDLINQSCMQFSHQSSTVGGNSNGQQQQNHCHPIDRLISDSLLNNQSKKELKSETQTKHSSNEISLAKTLIGGNGRTLLFPSKNHSNSSSSLYESSASPSIKLTNQKNDDNNTIQQSQSDLLWPFASTASAAAHQSILSSAKHLKENQNSTNKNLASLISPTTLMEGNLYNTIHMLQKMRHLCFELGMTPNSFERSSTTTTTTNRNFSSKENAQHEVETRIQMLGQLIKDSSFEALKRNLSMIEYLIDDILVHFINNNHQLPSSGSMIMERFKKRMFTNILDMLEDIFAEQLSNVSTNSVAEQQQLSNLKVEVDDDDVMVDDQKKSMSSSKDNEHLIAQDKIKKEQQQQQQSFDLDSDSKTTNSNNTIQEPSESVHSSYSSSIQIIEEDETQSPKEQKNDNDENIVDHSNVVDNHLAKDNNLSIPTTESNLIDSLVAHHLLTNGFHHNNHHPNRSTIEAINEQLSHAISTLAAAAASVSSSSSSSSPSLRSSPLSSNTIVPSLLSSTNKSFHHHHHNRMANQFHRNLSTNNVIVDDDDDDDDDTGTSSKATTSTTSTTTTNLTQQPSLLLATGSPN
ncbi:sno oncogene [Dermatophagoides pteronyssinus]|uniref:sno oncogene n=1 Tax=Dermatophagoides pteronyssinus TaxID=6956 RepID=UPI003F67C03A